MKTISFTEKEHNFLLNYYKDELEEAVIYAESIRNIVAKLEGELVQVKKPGRRGRKPKVVTETPVQPVKRGRRP